MSGRRAPVSAGGVVVPETERGAAGPARGPAARRDRRRDRLRRGGAGPPPRPSPERRVVGLLGRDRTDVPVGHVHPHLAVDRPRRGQRACRTPTRSSSPCPTASPRGSCPTGSPGARRSSTWAPTSGSATRPTTRAGTASSTRARTSSAQAVYGLPELHRAELAALREGGADRPGLVGAPGCYPTATLLALAPLARAGLIGDLVVDAKSGVSGAGRETKADLMFGEVNESVKAYGVGGHRHVAEIEQELARLDGEGGAGRGRTRARARSTSCPISSR